MELNKKICPFCNIDFDEDKIKDHIGFEHLGIPPTENESIRVEEAEISEKHYSCEMCPIQFKDYNSLKKHQEFVHLYIKNDF